MIRIPSPPADATPEAWEAYYRQIGDASDEALEPFDRASLAAIWGTSPTREVTTPARS